MSKKGADSQLHYHHLSSLYLCKACFHLMALLNEHHEIAKGTKGKQLWLSQTRFMGAVASCSS